MIIFKDKSKEYLLANQGLTQQTKPTLLTKKIKETGFFNFTKNLYQWAQ